TCGAPQIRRHRGGLGMDDFLLLFSVYTDYNISRRKINTDFLKAAVMLIRISNINMEIDIFGAEEIMWMPDVVAGEPFDESLDSGTGIALKEVLQWNIQL
ncbi:hypothetical protein, partial [Clostridium sp.]|uniref:hypothetical protein n=2 Tax=Clostridium sp. TaxID=1506 RepID=UPI00307C7368